MSRDIDRLLLHSHRDEVLRQKDKYLSSSNVEVFEASRRTAERQGMDEAAFVSYLKVGLSSHSL